MSSVVCGVRTTAAFRLRGVAVDVEERVGDDPAQRLQRHRPRAGGALGEAAVGDGVDGRRPHDDQLLRPAAPVPGRAGLRRRGGGLRGGLRGALGGLALGLRGLARRLGGLALASFFCCSAASCAASACSWAASRCGRGPLGGGLRRRPGPRRCPPPADPPPALPPDVSPPAAGACRRSRCRRRCRHRRIRHRRRCRHRQVATAAGPPVPPRRHRRPRQVRRLPPASPLWRRREACAPSACSWRCSCRYSWLRPPVRLGARVGLRVWSGLRVLRRRRRRVCARLRPG